MVNLIELPVNSIEVTEDIPFLARYFPNIFGQALALINPGRWPAFVAGSTMASDMPEFSDSFELEKIKRPLVLDDKHMNKTTILYLKYLRRFS